MSSRAWIDFRKPRDIAPRKIEVSKRCRIATDNKVWSP